MSSSKLAFSNNEPQEVALKYADGKLVQGLYGDQWYYSLAFPEGMGMYLDGEVAAKINLLEIRPNERFWICKRKSMGKGSRVTWDVWRGEQLGPVERKLDAEGERSKLTRDLGRSIDRAQSQTRPTNGSVHGELHVPKLEPPNTAGAGAGTPTPAQPTRIMPQPSSTVQPGESTPSNGTPARPKTQIEDCLLTAVEACYHAQERGRSIGYQVTFTSEDIAKIAMTLLIGKQQQNGRSAA